MGRRTVRHCRSTRRTVEFPHVSVACLRVEGHAGDHNGWSQLMRRPGRYGPENGAAFVWPREERRHGAVRLLDRPLEYD